MDLKISPGRTIREQVASFFRQQIRQGILRPGDQIPPARQIAQNLHVAEANVQHAMAQLAQEGLIARRRHTGSVVLTAQRILHHVGLFISWQYLERSEDYTRHLCRYITQELSLHNIATQIIYDTPDGAGRHQLQELVAEGRIQGLICRNIDDANGKFIDHLGIVYSGTSALTLPGCFSLLNDNLTDQFVETIAQSGVKTLGIITNTTSRSRRKSREKFLRKLENCDIEVRDEWIHDAVGFQTEADFLDSTKFAWSAAEYFNALPEPPRGLLLFSDDLIYGLALAFYHYHINIPERYQIFVHHTRENPVLFPFPCTLVQQSIQEISRLLVQNLLDLNNGQSPSSPQLTVWTTHIS